MTSVDLDSFWPLSFLSLTWTLVPLSQRCPTTAHSFPLLSLSLSKSPPHSPMFCCLWPCWLCSLALSGLSHSPPPPGCPVLPWTRTTLFFLWLSHPSQCVVLSFGIMALKKTLTRWFIPGLIYSLLPPGPVPSVLGSFNSLCVYFSSHMSSIMLTLQICWSVLSPVIASGFSPPVWIVHH